MRSAARFPAPLASLSRWLMLLCLPMSLLGCAGQPVTVRPPIDPPPANLAAECWAGPAWPDGATTVGQLLEVALAREAAAAECRAKHRALVQAWPRSGEGQGDQSGRP